MDRMTPLDAAFLQAEDSEDGVSPAIASVAVFDHAVLDSAPEPRPAPPGDWRPAPEPVDATVESLPLHALGRPVVETIPHVPIASTVRVEVSILSYLDRITFGVTGDRHAASDVDVLAHGIAAGLTELVAAATPVVRP